MTTYQDIYQAVQKDLNASTNSSLFPETTVKDYVNRAYIKCSRLFRWPQLEDAKLTTTQANIEYYDAPETWSPDSIWRLTVDGDDNVYGEDPDGSPMDYKDYLDWRADDTNTNSTDKKWAVQHLRYFIYPVPTEAGLVISIWGQKNVDELSDDSDETIFSNNMPECNEAIALEATAMLKRKGEDDKANEMFNLEAKQILTVAFGKLRQEQSKYEKYQAFFNVPDFFGGTSNLRAQVTGNF